MKFWYFRLSLCSFQQNELTLQGKKYTALFQNHEKSQVISPDSFAYLQGYTQIGDGGGRHNVPPLKQIGLIIVLD